MHAPLKSLFALAAVAFAAQASAQITFYENERFEGRQFTTSRAITNLTRSGFNDRASSAVVLRDEWEVCDDARFGGRCVVLRAGRIEHSLKKGAVEAASKPEPVYDNHRRNGERLFAADVTSVRAVVGPPEQRCWMEREAVSEPARPSGANVPAAIAGALIGGILGHQVGGGAGKDLATVGGAAAGGYVGSQIGRNGAPAPATSREVQKCETKPSQAKPEFWDVTYTFRGQEHRIQTTTPPGATLMVNDQGEPRS